MSNTETVTVLLLCLAGAICCAFWCVAFRRVLGGQRLLTELYRKRMPWGLEDVLLLMFLTPLLALAARWFVGVFTETPPQASLADMDASQRVWWLSLGAIVPLLAMGTSMLTVRIRGGRINDALGLALEKVFPDLKLGLMAFCMLAPPTYLLQALLTQWFESNHPLIHLLRESPNSTLFILTGLSAVVAAPLAEEYLYRVVLQGWLDNVAMRATGGDQLRWGVKSSENPALPENPFPESLQSPPNLSVKRSVYGIDQEGSGGSDAVRKFSWWPVFVSAAIFALMHVAHGPDWVPLFIFAIGLGFLYQRTGRILPCLIVHVLLNACSLTVLFLELYFEVP